jgi:hypothetical protein
VRRDPAAQLRSATFGYVSGNTVGDLTLDIDIIRRGRAMTTTHARITQNGAHAAAPERREAASRGGTAAVHAECSLLVARDHGCNGTSGMRLGPQDAHYETASRSSAQGPEPSSWSA